MGPRAQRVPKSVVSMRRKKKPNFGTEDGRREKRQKAEKGTKHVESREARVERAPKNA